MHVQGRGTGDKVGALRLIADRKVRMKAMRMLVPALVVLLGGALAAHAEDTPPPPAAAAPVRIIDATPAPPAAPKTDQTLPAAPPAVSTQDKTVPTRPQDGARNHFSFVRVDDGFLRFDLETGQVAYCNSRKDGWGCQAVPENRSALEREVRGLKDAVAALKRQVEELRQPPPPPRPPVPIPPPATPAPPAQGDIMRDGPRHADMDRAKAVLQDVWQRLVEAIVGFKNDVLRKS
jgi:hypothetical protein